MAYVVLTGTAELEGDQFVSHCPQLDIASCGDTVNEALDNLGEALEVHLAALEEIGELERVFREHGIEIKKDRLPFEDVSVSIPPEKTVRAYARAVPSAEVA